MENKENVKNKWKKIKESRLEGEATYVLEKLFTSRKDIIFNHEDIQTLSWKL